PGRWAEARSVAEQAIRNQQAAVRLAASQHAPHYLTYRRLLREHHRFLAHILLQLGDHEAAAEKAAAAVRESPRSWPELYFAADVLVNCVPLAEKDDKLSPAERAAKVREYAGRTQLLLYDIARLAAADPNAEKGLARFLALRPLPQGGDPERAVRLAKGALERSPKDADSWTTLGVALYRTERWAAAVTALEQAAALRPGGDGLDWF